MTQSINEIVIGMNPAEKQVYLNHMAKRAKEDVEYMQTRIDEHKAYKARLIADVLKYRPNDFTEEELKHFSVKRLEYLI